MEQETAIINVVLQEYETLINRFIISQDIARVSRSTYKSSLRQFFNWFFEQNVKNPTRETILAYKESLDAKGLRPFTRSSYLVAVRKFFEWAEGLKIYPNIAKGIKGAKRSLKSHQKDSLSVEQIKLLLNSINTKTFQGQRDFALINLLFRTGLRLIEIARADIEDLQVDGDEALLWIRGKGRDGKDDFVVLTETAVTPIMQYLRTRKAKDKKQPLFGSLSDRNNGKRITTFSLSRLIKSYLRKAGLQSRRLTAHSLRHTFGVLSIKAGASLYEVQLAMRHTAPTTTELYLGDIERIKRREAAPERRLNALFQEEKI
ncbi:MAG TPA: tyrosine-type recombinase/integrase [Candidatus Babeliaceae bacterium]|nr:tyrosine-type recombinase/integrase [Candidatus Babeliaceae bacterium]